MARVLRLDVSVRDDGGDLLEGVEVHVTYLRRWDASGGNQLIGWGIKSDLDGTSVCLVGMQRVNIQRAVWSVPSPHS